MPDTLGPVRFSNLKHIGRSPLHYHHAVTVGRDDKPWLRGGRGLHCVLFEQPYITYSGDSRRGKAWDQFCAEVTGPYVDAGPEVVLAKELATYQQQAKAVREELLRLGMSRILEGTVEHRIEWEWLGRSCAGTPDVVGSNYITDVKTTCNADPRKFHWDARRFGYAEQLVWYSHGACVPSDDLFVVAVEKAAPFPVVVWRVTDAMRIQAEKTLRLWMEQLLACEAADSWPGYTQCVQDLDVLDSGGALTLTIDGEEIEA